MTKMEARQLLRIGRRARFLALIGFQCQSNECGSGKGSTREEEEEDDEEDMRFYASVQWYFAIWLHNVYGTRSPLFLEDQHLDESHTWRFPVFPSSVRVISKCFDDGSL